MLFLYAIIKMQPKNGKKQLKVGRVQPVDYHIINA